MRELDAVLGIFSSLLRISRIEALDLRATFRLVDLDQVAGEVAELFDAAAEEKGGRVKFERGGRVPVLGDRDLLFDAISNLIDSAIKHGGAGDVQITVRNDDHGPTISVADRESGIPLEERKQAILPDRAQPKQSGQWPRSQSCRFRRSAAWGSHRHGGTMVRPKDPASVSGGGQLGGRPSAPAHVTRRATGGR